MGVGHSPGPGGTRLAQHCLRGCRGQREREEEAPAATFFLPFIDWNQPRWDDLATWECILQGHALWCRTEPPRRRETGADSNQAPEGTLPFSPPLLRGYTQSSFPTQELLLNLNTRNFRTHVVMCHSSNNTTSSGETSRNNVLKTGKKKKKKTYQIAMQRTVIQSSISGTFIGNSVANYFLIEFCFSLSLEYRHKVKFCKFLRVNQIL